MPIVNYVREHRRFIKYASDEKLTASERLLWYALMEIFNQEAEGNVWPDDFIRISNNRLLAVLEPMGIDTMVRARNALKQHGRIDFRPGSRNKLNPSYRMMYFYPEGYTQNTYNENQSYTQNADNIQGNIGVNIPGNMGGNMGGNMPANMGNILVNQNKGYTQTGFGDDEEELLDDSACAIIDGSFCMALGRRAYPAELRRICTAGLRMGFDPLMIGKAVEVAAEEGAQKPVQYALAILQDWKDADVMQEHQIEGYRLDEEIRRGKATLASTGDPDKDAARREKRHEERVAENLRVLKQG